MKIVPSFANTSNFFFVSGLVCSFIRNTCLSEWLRADHMLSGCLRLVAKFPVSVVK